VLYWAGVYSITTHTLTHPTPANPPPPPPPPPSQDKEAACAELEKERELHEMMEMMKALKRDVLAGALVAPRVHMVAQSIDEGRELSAKQKNICL
jgi:hypothetical protein